MSRPQDVEVYVAAYKKPGAMRAAFEAYRTFEKDAKENKMWIEEHGRCKVPAMALNGIHSRHAARAETIGNAAFANIKVDTVDNCGHYLAEENPEEYVKKVLAFVDSSTR